MDQLKIDSHKLSYHIKRVNDWLKNKDIYPIYMEISPAGGCNHRCIFCALDYTGYEPNLLKTKDLKNFLKEAAEHGLKSIMLAGEGEPLLHKDIAGIIHYARGNGLDVAITTNGVLLSENIINKVLPELSWLRVSLNAGRDETYAKIHGTNKEDFYRVINNIQYAVKIKRENNYSSTIGIQTLLLDENYNEISLLAERLKDIGADYLTIKPYSHHPQSKNKLNPDLNSERILKLKKRLNKYETADFNIIFRDKAVKELKRGKPYKKCLGLPFWAYLTSKGDLYACSTFLKDERFCYGNIYKESFRKIWKGKKRKKIMEMMDKDWDINNCRRACRLDSINKYLWDLKNPPQHVNFI